MPSLAPALPPLPVPVSSGNSQTDDAASRTHAASSSAARINIVRPGSNAVPRNLPANFKFNIPAAALRSLDAGERNIILNAEQELTNIPSELRVIQINKETGEGIFSFPFHCPGTDGQPRLTTASLYLNLKSTHEHESEYFHPNGLKCATGGSSAESLVVHGNTSAPVEAPHTELLDYEPSAAMIPLLAAVGKKRGPQLSPPLAAEQSQRTAGIESPMETPADDQSFDNKVLVIGAGPAGLTAAGKLKKMGYEVICCEAAGEAGGKVNCITVEDDGFTEKIDYGAVGAIGTPNRLPVVGKIIDSVGRRVGGMTERILNGDYTELFKLSKRHDLKLIDFNTSSCLFDGDGKPIKLSVREMARLMVEVLRYAHHLAKWKIPLSGPTAEPPPELCQPWKDLVKEKKWETLDRQINFFLRGAGYQDQGENGEAVDDKTAALYVVQYMNLAALASLVFSGICGWKDGAQEMWKREADELRESGVDVRINHAVTRIVRQENSIKACSSNGEWETFGKIVVCCDPKTLIEENAEGQRILQDASEEEINVFSKLHTVDLRTIIVKVTGFPDAKLTNQFSFIKDRIDGRPGHFFGWFKKSNPNVYAFYVNGSGLPEERVQEILRADVEELGGQITKHFGYKEWKNYFPHVDPEDMDFFPRMDQLQGRGNLYYAGGALSFDDMRSASDNATSIVARLHRDVEASRNPRQTV